MIKMFKTKLNSTHNSPGKGLKQFYNLNLANRTTQLASTINDKKKGKERCRNY